MQQYDSNCTSRTNWFDLAGTHCSLSEHEPYNAFQSMGELLNTEVDDVTLPAYFGEQSDVSSPWNTDWTAAAAYGGGLKFNNPVFGNGWTKYYRAHAWFNCHPEEPSECEGHNCHGTHSTEGHAPAAAATAQSVPVPLNVIEPPTPTPSEIYGCNWHW